MYQQVTSPRGFTLIELSIVLVIIGLIVGGVLVGQDLIRAAERRSVLSDIEKFTAAVRTFQSKYYCIPGDCTNATTFFGASAACGAGMGANNNPGTCNGNGNGQIELFAPDPPGPVPSANWFHDEVFAFWQELGLAGMIAGSYSGSIPSTSSMASFPGVNVPPSRISSSSCYSVGFSSNGSFVGGNMYQDPATNVFSLGNSTVNEAGMTTVWCKGGVMSAQDALLIDQKIDDGAPYTGNVQTPQFNFSYATGTEVANPCSNSSSPYIYAGSGSADCALVFLAGF